MIERPSWAQPGDQGLRDADAKVPKGRSTKSAPFDGGELGIGKAERQIDFGDPASPPSDKPNHASEQAAELQQQPKRQTGAEGPKADRYPGAEYARMPGG